MFAFVIDPAAVFASPVHREVAESSLEGFLGAVAAAPVEGFAQAIRVAQRYARALRYPVVACAL